VENVVRECSLLANESIWSIQAFDTEPERIRVHGCGENSGSVELAFDSTKSVLHCRFGSSTADEHWVYYVTPDGTTLLRSGREYNLGQAVNLILDQLVSG